MIVIDIETTGLDPRKHSIVSIGAIDLSNPKRQFYVENQIWEGAEIYEGDEVLELKALFRQNQAMIELLKQILEEHKASRKLLGSGEKKP